MEIIHNRNKERNENVAFSVSYGDKTVDTTLQKMERTLLHQMGNVLSVVHGGQFKNRRSYISA